MALPDLDQMGFQAEFKGHADHLYQIYNLPSIFSIYHICTRMFFFLFFFPVTISFEGTFAFKCHFFSVKDKSAASIGKGRQCYFCSHHVPVITTI